MYTAKLEFRFDDLFVEVTVPGFPKWSDAESFSKRPFSLDFSLSQKLLTLKCEDDGSWFEVLDGEFALTKVKDESKRKTQMDERDFECVGSKIQDLLNAEISGPLLLVAFSVESSNRRRGGGAGLG